jgi:hypothetical protein
LLLPQELEHWCPFLGSTPVSPVSCLPFLWRWLARPRRRARLYLTGPSHVEEVPSKNKKKTHVQRGGGAARTPISPHGGQRFARSTVRLPRSRLLMPPASALRSLGVDDGWPPAALGPVGRDGLAWERARRWTSSLARSPLPTPPTLAFATAARGAGGVSGDPRRA